MVCQLLFVSFLRWCGYANLAGSLHLELVHGLAGLGNIDAVVLLRHFLFSFSIFGGSAAYRQRRIGRRNRSRPFLLELRRRADVFVLRPCRNHIICIPAPNMPPAHPVIFCRKKAQCLCFKKVMLPPFEKGGSVPVRPEDVDRGVADMLDWHQKNPARRGPRPDRRSAT